MQAQTIARGRLNADMQAAEEIAKAENREVSREERNAIVKKNHGLIPGSIEKIPADDPEAMKSKMQSTYDKIEYRKQFGLYRFLRENFDELSVIPIK